MAKPKLNLNESEVSQTIDLGSLLGKGAAKNETLRETFFQLAYDKLLERLSVGRGVDGKILPKYSKAYKNSLAYAAFGKDGTVNMQLTGDMINSVSILKKDSNNITVGFSKTESAKAYGHITGFEGHPTLDGKVKPREFFGWTDKELNDIAKEIKPQVNNKELISDALILKVLDKVLSRG
jgi:hypothetical protein